MKVVITGGRSYGCPHAPRLGNHDAHVVEYEQLQVLEETRRLIRDAFDKGEPLEVAHGGAVGADSLADYFFRRAGVSPRVYNAAWGVYGKRAGPLRNLVMLRTEKPDLVVAFPGKPGGGTSHCTRAAQRLGFEVVQVDPRNYGPWIRKRKGPSPSEEAPSLYSKAGGPGGI